MMKSIGLALAASIALGLTNAESDAQESGNAGPSQRLPPSRELPANMPPTQPKGSAAIAPHLATVPAFTLDDARQYVTTHRLPFRGPPDYKPQITTVEFLTSQQVSERIHRAKTGFGADHLFCYVELQGPFSFGGPQGAVATYSRGVLIFDAQTGNLVISGGMP